VAKKINSGFIFSLTEPGEPKDSGTWSYREE
jgi:hypothetical protein